MRGGKSGVIRMIQVQPFVEIYSNKVADLILSIQQQEFDIAITLNDQPDLLAIRQTYQKGSGNFWLALAESQVVGTIGLLDIGDSNVALRKMFVHPSYRGKAVGVSSLLLSTVVRWCETKTVKTIYLGTTSKFLAAHRFYEKNGFVEIAKSALPAPFPLMSVDTKFYRLDI
jgi:GNAT superfamily N-acetyltransferase